ncbi:MAG: putative toxin-antitoxin system toxin component, PIN family [Candidatus Aegiribacteria sp.]|nr:putative toxin-antitoxin system toxin component, PIN family [Candidatus Aegiribacteria sp.]
MRVVIDTNVLISAIFFKGKPDVILDAWRNGKLEVTISAEIFNEYSEVLHRLADKYITIDTSGILYLLAAGSKFIEPMRIDKPVCADPDDDKFIAAAIAGAARTIISGDRHLLEVNGYSGIEILGPSEFIDKYLSEQTNAAKQHDD